MQGLKSERKPDGTGKQVEDWWPTSKKLLGEMNFLSSLKEFDKDNIPDVIIRKIRAKYTTNPDFDPDKIKNVSSACEGLCRWVRAIETYDEVAKVVAPKKASLEKAEGEFGGLMSSLRQKQGELKAVTDKLQKLNDDLEVKQAEKKVRVKLLFTFLFLNDFRFLNFVSIT